MSQKKVDQYKKEKANRKKIIAREKRQAFLMKVAGILILVAFFGFIGGSVYFKWFDKKDSSGNEVETYALSDEEVSEAFEEYETKDEVDTEDNADAEEDTTSSGDESETIAAGNETETTAAGNETETTAAGSETETTVAGSEAETTAAGEASNE